MTSQNDRAKQWERIAKGLANRRRLIILLVLERTPERRLTDLAEELHWNIHTTAEHTRRLSHAGLILKRRDRQSVSHTLSDRGKRFMAFLGKLK